MGLPELKSEPSIDWIQVRSLYEACKDQPRAFQDELLASLGSNDLVRREVIQLLEASSIQQNFIPAPIERIPEKENLPRRLGRYVLLHKLGEGGMASVYLASLTGPEGFHKKFAVKILPQEAKGVEPLKKLLFYEAQILSQLNHPNIVPIFEFTEAEGRQFLVMEFLRGANLHSLVDYCHATHAQIPLALTLHIIYEVCTAMDYAHTLQDGSGLPFQLVHRDLSTNNVMISHDGNVKLVDFGIAKARGRSTVTEEGMVRGTWNFIAPEIFGGAPASHRSDIYAIGKVLEALFSVSSYEKAGLAIPPEIADPETWIRTQVQGLIKNATEHIPIHRIQSAKEFGRQIISLVDLTWRLQASKELSHFVTPFVPEIQLTQPADLVPVGDFSAIPEKTAITSLAKNGGNELPSISLVGLNSLSGSVKKPKVRHFSAALIVELILLAVVVLEAGLLLWQPIEKAYQMDGQGRVQMLYVGSQSGQCQVLFKPHIENTAVTINDQALVALGSLKAFVPCGKSLLFNFREGGKDYSQIYKITQPVTILTPTLGEELSQSHLHFVLTHWYFKHLRLWEYFF